MVVGNAIILGWNAAIPGREKRALEQFMEIHAWFEELKSQKTITGYQDVILNPHGGDMNGFTLLTGDPAKLSELTRTDKWNEHVIRAALNLSGFGVQLATTGDAVPGLMQTWAKFI